MTNIICNECETVAHCVKNGCVPKQPAYRAVKTYHEGKPVYVAGQPAQKRPQNCGTGYCSCIECVMEPAQPIIKSYPEKDNSAQQEPVAWMYQCSADNSGPVLMQHKQDWAKSGSGLWTEVPLFTSPPLPEQEPVELCQYGQEPASCTSNPMDCQCAIDAALAQPEQEPVAWKHDCAALLTNNVELWIDRCPHCGKPRTSPPAQRTWVGLDELREANVEIKRLKAMIESQDMVLVRSAERIVGLQDEIRNLTGEE